MKTQEIQEKSSDQNVLNTVDVVDWRKWLEKILEVGKISTHEK